MTPRQPHRAVGDEHDHRARAALRLPHLATPAPTAGAAPSRRSSAATTTARPGRPGAASEVPAAASMALEPATPATRTVTGPAAETDWGPVQVELTVTGSGSTTTITDVSVSSTPTATARTRDQRLRAADPGAGDPRRPERPDRHGQRRDLTSQGYLASLQAALDEAQA